MTAAVQELAAVVTEAVDAAEKRFYGFGPVLAEVYQRRAEVHRLTAEGLSTRQIAEIVGMSQRNVTRSRSLPVPTVEEVPPPPMPPAPGDITDERADELEQAADLVIDLACRLQEENPLLVWDALSRMKRWDLQELVVLLLATVRLDATKAELFGWVLDLPAAKEDQE